MLIFLFLARKTNLILFRIAIILCCIMIVLCVVLIVYDILVLIDPTRCFILSCASAEVTYQVNSTHTATVTGWPLHISWPDDFQNKMNNKRIFQSIQIFCAVLFILFCSLYILTYLIYRRANFDEQFLVNTDQRDFLRQDATANAKQSSNNLVRSYPYFDLNALVATYHIESRPQTSIRAPPVETINTPRKLREKTATRSRTASMNYARICTRCLKEPRMVLTTNYERENFFSHLCSNCNNELLTYRRKGPTYSSTNYHM